MIIARCFAGVFAGTVVTVRAMLSENSTKHTQAAAFSYFAFSRNIGLFVGPLLGGVLESPATKYSGTFGKIKFFRDFPYVLPGMVTSLVALSGALLVMLFVKEVHPHNTLSIQLSTDHTRLFTPTMIKRKPPQSLQ